MLDAPHVRRGRDFWRRLVSEVDGGERIADVAGRHRVQPRTLTWWRWKLRADDRHEPLLLPVVVRRPEAVAEPTLLELRIRDVIIRVASGSDVAYIAALVDALRP
jgi:transposase-like protein